MYMVISKENGIAKWTKTCYIIVMFKTPTNDWQKGYEMTFDNGWTISVKWGAGAEGSNFTEDMLKANYRSNATARTAEVAAIYGDPISKDADDLWWNFKEDYVEPDNRTSVSSFIRPDAVADMIITVKNLYQNEMGRWVNGIHLGAFNRTKPPKPARTDDFATVDLRHEIY